MDPVILCLSICSRHIIKHGLDYNLDWTLDSGLWTLDFGLWILESGIDSFIITNIINYELLILNCKFLAFPLMT